MKASELMIGDYVAVEPSGMTIQIAAIHKSKVGYHSVENKLSWVRIGLLRPIPLTEEFYEKVGYAVCNEPFRNGLVSVTVYEYDGFMYMGQIVRVGRRRPVTGCHELQQLLRIGGVEKELTIN